jgi:hypothetical protein
MNRKLCLIHPDARILRRGKAVHCCTPCVAAVCPAGDRLSCLGGAAHYTISIYASINIENTFGQPIHALILDFGLVNICNWA